MKINKFIVTVILVLTIILLFQNFCFADEIYISPYEEYSQSLTLIIVMYAIIVTIFVSINILNKKKSILTIVLIYIGIGLLLMYNLMYLFDDYSLGLGFILLIVIMLILGILLFYFKNTKVVKIILIIFLLINIMIIPCDKLKKYLTEKDAYVYRFSGGGYDYYIEIENFNSQFLEYEGKKSYKEVIDLIELLKSNYNRHYGEVLRIPFVNYISKEKTKSMITEFKEENVDYYAAKRHEKKLKGNSLYYLYDPYDAPDEYLDFLNELEGYLEEEKKYSIEIQQMDCINEYHGHQEYSIVHVINIYEQ